MLGDFQAYYRNRKSLPTENGCLYYRDRLVIPQDLRQQVLSTLHQNHDGIVRMKMLARSVVWWPNIDESIQSLNNNCFACQSTQRVPKEVVTTKWPASCFPFQRVHIDFFYFKSRTFYIFIDSYSKFIEVKMLTKTDAFSLCNSLLSIFRTFGCPEEIVTDNGPPFTSSYFENFAKEWSIILSKSPAYHP